MPRFSVPNIVILTIAILLLGFFCAEMHDASIINHDLVEHITAVSNLKQIGLDILDYKHEHKGRLPTSWAALTPYLRSNPYTADQDILKCPYSSEDPCYTCTYRDAVRNNDLLCWTSRPHKHQSTLFSHPADEYRVVLYGDGHCEEI